MTDVSRVLSGNTEGRQLTWTYALQFRLIIPMILPVGCFSFCALGCSVPLNLFTSRCSVDSPGFSLSSTSESSASSSRKAAMNRIQFISGQLTRSRTILIHYCIRRCLPFAHWEDLHRNNVTVNSTVHALSSD